MSADQKSDGLKKLLEGWIEQLKVIREEVRSLLLGAKIFWEVQKILEDNPRSLSHPLFNRWIASNYFVATAVGIRRQLDKDSRSVSLKKVLMAIETALDQRSDLLSRPDFLLNFRPGEHKSDGDALFSKLVGVGATRAEPTYVRQDIERLSGETEKIERYVNKRIAHRDAQAIDRRKFGELDKCLRLLV